MVMRYCISERVACPTFINYKQLPNDLVDVSDEDHLRILNRAANEDFAINSDGSVDIFEMSPAMVSVEQKIKNMEQLVQTHLDQTAKDQGFDDMARAMQGAVFPGAHQAKSLAMGTWYYAVWEGCKKLLTQWQTGEIDEPTVEVIMAALPPYVAPQSEG